MGGLSKLFVEFLVAKKFLEKKGEGGVSIFSVENFLSQIAEKFRRGTFSLSFFRVSKKFMLRRVLSHFSIDFFLSHSTGTFRRGTLLCCVSDHFRLQKNYGKEVGKGDYLNFPSRIFVSQYRNTRRGTLLCCVSENCW